ncbi:hypothetical protein HAX54_045446 [Datura stramonium]|uniref:Uncharacterized protein n=1 Tax=Datura stramonium TaxID=4076 RepID=A0ABS8SQL7_DATST|nr:hypothetical protein [Datura stramonium]
MAPHLLDPNEAGSYLKVLHNRVPSMMGPLSEELVHKPLPALNIEVGRVPPLLREGHYIEEIQVVDITKINDEINLAAKIYLDIQLTMDSTPN